MALAKWFRSLFGGKNTENSDYSRKSQEHDNFLASEQRDLAERAMNTWKALESSLDEVSVKLRHAKNNPGAKKKILHEQQMLKAALLRLETSLKKSQDLRREMSEWKRAVHEKQDKISLKHPVLMQAMIKSELDLRSAIEDGILPLPKETVLQSDERHVGNVGPEAVRNDIVQPTEEPKAYRVVKVKTAESQVPPHDPDGLVKTIRHISRELAQETQKKHKDKVEIVSFLHQLKDLHGALRLTDRANGKVRDRLAITDGFRHVFTHH